jgi:Secretion system C-terminal sorting domain
MKKIYSVALILLSLWSTTVSAQCPGPFPSIAGAVTFNGNATVFIAFGLPNARVVLLDANGVEIPIPPTFTNFLGSALVAYVADDLPAVIQTVSATGQVCIALIFAAADLPVKIKSFTAQVQNSNSVMLRWVSEVELNASKYIIQKSTDGRNFTDVGELQAAGNSASPLNYVFADKQGSGAAYYRLKMIDLDGKFEYTKIIYINNGEISLGPLSVFPNPFRSEVQLKGVSSSDVNSKNIKIYNTMGSEVAYRVVGGNSITIDPSLPTGVYILRVKGQTFKLFKE